MYKSSCMPFFSWTMRGKPLTYSSVLEHLEYFLLLLTTLFNYFQLFSHRSIGLASSFLKFRIYVILWYFEFFLKPPSSPETPTPSMAPPSSTPSYAPQSVSTQSSTADTLSESTINLKRELEVSSSSFFVFSSSVACTSQCSSHHCR